MEDKNYSKLLESIQKEDYCTILDFHYRLLAKSQYGIDKKYACVFDEIDNPTEKERAEIRKINADTDSVYINAGVVSPEEIRNVLRADEKSGYTALGEEMEGEPSEEENDLFNEEGGSSTEQDPFSLDDDTEFRTTENGVKFPLKEGESTEESCKEFFEEKEKEQQYKPSQRYNNVKNRQRKPVDLPYQDKAAIRNTILQHGFNDDEIKDGYASRFGANYGVVVKIINAEKGNLQYNIIKKWKLD